MPKLRKNLSLMGEELIVGYGLIKGVQPNLLLTQFKNHTSAHDMKLKRTRFLLYRKISHASSMC